MNLTKLFDDTKKIHVLGLSPKQNRDSNKIAHYLKNAGFEVIGIRPGELEVDGFKAFPSISDVPGEIEILDVFRSSENVPAIVDEAIAHGGVKLLWLQLGVEHPEAEKKARESGIQVISNQCIKIEHRNLFG